MTNNHANLKYGSFHIHLFLELNLICKKRKNEIRPKSSSEIDGKFDDTMKSQRNATQRKFWFFLLVGFWFRLLFVGWFRFLFVGSGFCLLVGLGFCLLV